MKGTTMARSEAHGEHVSEVIVAPNNAQPVPDRDVPLSYNRRLHRWWGFDDGEVYCKHCRLYCGCVRAMEECKGPSTELTYERLYDEET